MINIALCDDNLIEMLPIEGFIKNYMKKHDIEYKIQKYEDGLEMINSTISFDIIFMDIEFDGNNTNGIDIIKKLREYDENANVFFVSNSDSRAYIKAGYKVQAFSYLNKPVDESEFNYEFALLMEKVRKSNIYILDERVSKEKINLNEILFVEFFNRKSTLFTNDKSYASYVSLKEWTSMLSSYGFIRVHHSYIVNLEKIVKTNSEDLIIENSKSLPIGRAYKDRFRKEYYRYLRGKI